MISLMKSNYTCSISSVFVYHYAKRIVVIFVELTAVCNSYYSSAVNLFEPAPLHRISFNP